jgi:hypothetical protein
LAAAGPRTAAVEIHVERGDATAHDVAAFDDLLRLAFGASYSRPEPAIGAVAGAPAIRTATLTLAVDFGMAPLFRGLEPSREGVNPLTSGRARLA